MIETKKFLTPIEPDLPPPKHTQLLPRCFICKHFPVCNIREDYLKTAQLIEEVLGAPCESYELYPTPIPVPEFIGTIIEDVKAYFPTTVLSTKDKEGSFYVAKYTDSKTDKTVSILEQISTGRDEQTEITNRIAIKNLISELDDKEKEIIMLRYYKQKTQMQVSKILGITQVQVSRIERKVLEKMRIKLIS